MNELALTEQNFAAEVDSAATPMLVYFWGISCGNCQVMGPILEQIGQERAGAVKIAKIDAGEEMSLAARFNVRGLPTFLFLKGGQVKDTHVGAVSKAGLLKKLDAIIAS